MQYTPDQVCKISLSMKEGTNSLGSDYLTGLVVPAISPNKIQETRTAFSAGFLHVQNLNEKHHQ